MLNALKADAKTVDLRALCGHFYEFSTRVLELYPYVQEAEDMTDLLSEVSLVVERGAGRGNMVLMWGLW